MLSITKLQNLKSNSQRYKISVSLSDSCYQSQNYKIWKQFTTCIVRAFLSTVLLSITKLQNLKAIHNGYYTSFATYWLLSITKLQNLKAIHNHTSVKVPIVRVVINHKTTKFESNSQQKCLPNAMKEGCYQSQNYKIWKQFTTY